MNIVIIISINNKQREELRLSHQSVISTMIVIADQIILTIKVQIAIKAQRVKEIPVNKKVRRTYH